MNQGVQCSIDGCGNAAQKENLCWAHRKRRQREQPVNAPLVDRPKAPEDKLARAAINMPDKMPEKLRDSARGVRECSEDEEAWRRANDNLRKMAISYTLSLPKFRPLAEYLKQAQGFQGHAGGSA